MMNIICFEYILLEFRSLINWIYAPEDEFRIKRKAAIQARNALIEAIQSGDLNYKKFQKVIDLKVPLETAGLIPVVAGMINKTMTFVA